MNFNYNNYKVWLQPSLLKFTNTGAGTVALAYASDVPTINHTAAADTPILKFPLAKLIRADLGLNTSVSMRINSVTLGYSIATADITTHTARLIKITVDPATGLTTRSVVTLSAASALGTVQTAGKIAVTSPALTAGVNKTQSILTVTNLDDVEFEVTPVCAATSVYKITSIMVDVDILDS